MIYLEREDVDAAHFHSSDVSAQQSLCRFRRVELLQLPSQDVWPRGSVPPGLVPRSCGSLLPSLLGAGQCEVLRVLSTALAEHCTREVQLWL